MAQETQEEITVAENQPSSLKLLYSDVDIKIDEEEKAIIINQAGERFYNSGCDDLHTIFRDASISVDANGTLQIQGVQTLYNKHFDSGVNYDELLCKHPEQLIKKRSFLGLFTYYSVNGSVTREVKAFYTCEHKNYRITQRCEVLSVVVEDAREKKSKN